jgi:glycine cleavage system H protein
VDGVVADVNGELTRAPELVNQEPYGRGWMILLTPSDPAQFERLMTPPQYAAFIEGRH